MFFPRISPLGIFGWRTCATTTGWLSLFFRFFFPQPVPGIISGVLKYEVESILLHQAEVRRVESLVSWKDIHKNTTRWEPADAILEHCQNLDNQYWIRQAGSKGTGRKGPAGRPSLWRAQTMVVGTCSPHK
jgi:hypothetical protein